MTHSELVIRATRWLAGTQKCRVVLGEPIARASSEQPDAVGWRRGVPILIECKASRSDFHSDKSKSFRRNTIMGIGVLRYYMAPKGVLSPEDMPEGWGLLSCEPHCVRVLKKPVPFDKHNSRAEACLMTNALLYLKFGTTFNNEPVVILRNALRATESACSADQRLP